MNGFISAACYARVMAALEYLEGLAFISAFSSKEVVIVHSVIQILSLHPSTIAELNPVDPN